MSPPAVDSVFDGELFDDTTVLVTGGGTGIGRAIALGFATLGGDVAVASRSMDHLEPVADAIEERGQQACATTVDIREPDAVESMVETVERELGPVDVLINNAGANFLTPTESLSPNGWRAVVGTILDGTAYCTMAVGERMIDRDGGVIISIGATNSEHGAPFHAHSGAGKAGVHNLMQTVASEWAKHGIRANTIAPGIVETDGITDAAGGALPESLTGSIPADRFGTPADCVPTVLFMASPAAAYVTGSYLTVDGGLLLADPMA
ncbi:SDR family oxidoreductase [Halocatena halophila]|uniref:SDR family oxidoreductase n=1 Tax=Halocatena halophila TaxID=2814576 RepID=UPI002ED6964A